MKETSKVAYEWAAMNADDVQEYVHSRDPRKFQFGGFFGDGMIEMVFWFSDERELLTYLYTSEPIIVGVDAAMKEDQKDCVERVRSQIVTSDHKWSETLKAKLEAIFEEFGCDFSFGWVGNFDDLRYGKGDGAGILEEFAEDHEELQENIMKKGVPDQLVDEFVEMLASRGY